MIQPIKAKLVDDPASKGDNWPFVQKIN